MEMVFDVDDDGDNDYDDDDKCLYLFSRNFCFYLMFSYLNQIYFVQ